MRAGKKNRLELAEKTRSSLNQFASDSGTLLPLQPRPACRQLDESLQEESAERLRAAASTTEVIEGSYPPPSAAARRNRPRADASLTRRARSGGRARALGRCQPAALRAAQHHVAAARVRERGGGVHPQAWSGRPGCGAAPPRLSVQRGGGSLTALRAAPCRAFISTSFDTLNSLPDKLDYGQARDGFCLLLPSFLARPAARQAARTV